MADYITVAEFKARQGITQIVDDVTIGAVVTEASRMIDGLCGRTFETGSEASARVYQPIDEYVVWIDDAWSVTGIATDTAGDASYSTSWVAADYQLLPLNGVGKNSQTGWPYTSVQGVGTKGFPLHRRASVQVTAKWGWAACPSDIKGATFLLANRLYEERKAPFGTVGNADFGALPIRDQRTVNRMLLPYMRNEPVIA